MRLDWNDDVRRQAQLPQDAQLLLATSDADQHVVRDVAAHLRPTRSGDLGCAERRIVPNRVLLCQLPGKVPLGRIGVREADCSQRAVRSEQVGRAPVGELRHGQAGDAFERLLVFQRRPRIAVASERKRCPTSALSARARAARSRSNSSARSRSYCLASVMSVVTATASSIFPPLSIGATAERMVLACPSGRTIISSRALASPLKARANPPSCSPTARPVVVSRACRRFRMSPCSSESCSGVSKPSSSSPRRLVVVIRFRSAMKTASGMASITARSSAARCSASRRSICW